MQRHPGNPQPVTALLKAISAGVRYTGSVSRLKNYSTRTLKNIMELVGAKMYGEAAVFVVQGPATLVDCRSVPCDQ